MPRGGSRPGAGRPKGSTAPQTFEKQAARELARQLITAKLTPLIEAQIAQALGIKYLLVRNRGTGQFVRVARRKAKRLKPSEEIIEVWEKDPSTAAFVDLMNRAIDKPKEHVEMEVHGDWEKRVALLVRARGRGATYDARQRELEQHNPTRMRGDLRARANRSV